jgi:hypothetical protein
MDFILFAEASQELAKAYRSRDEDRGTSEAWFKKAMNLSRGIVDQELVDDLLTIYHTTRIACAWSDEVGSTEGESK